MASPVSVVRSTVLHLPKVLGLGAIFLVAIAFVCIYVFHYYLHYNPAGFDVYWPRRFGLLAHITCGMVALLIGPWQFSNRLRRRHLQLHRLMGRAYLIAIACGSVAAIYLAVTTTFGWAWGLSLIALALAWISTSGVAFYAVKHRRMQTHQEWMIRSYIVTFAFVTFRLLNDFGPTSHLQPAGERAIAFVWASWVLPLLAAEAVLELRRISGKPAPLRS
jgi:uncharacterized membrane protein